MIFVTGDCHGDFSRFNTKNFPEQKNMTKQDYVIIAGDFGGVWASPQANDYKQSQYWLNWLDSKNFMTLFVDGNHENFDLLNQYPDAQWHGGIVHVIRPSVLHLMRGEFFELQGKTFFTAGGASSHDIQDGIISRQAADWKAKILKLIRRGQYMYRIEGVNWWREELPHYAEIEYMRQKLQKNEMKTDYIITHCTSTTNQRKISPFFKSDALTDFFEIFKDVEYTNWFFGHYHIDKQITETDIAVYQKIIRIL